MVSEQLAISFNDEGSLELKDQYSGAFSELNYNSNVKQLSFSQLIQTQPHHLKNLVLFLKQNYLEGA